ncbi:MAG: hypothetical protein KTR18_06275 [Acidiferrobacterales bacterium]|nr:hypothetical protein [Acidiferrobacterales bacterium]
MAKRVSALDGHFELGRFGSDGATGVTLSVVKDLQLIQVAAWPDSMDEVGQMLAEQVGANTIASPGKSISGSTGSMLRVEPFKWWLLGSDAPDLSAEQGATLDLSHSRTRVRVVGDEAVALLNRLLPLDLRESQFPEGSVASSAIHHVGVTLWRSEQSYELFIPRGFAVSVWEVLFESALQFGVEVA